MRFTTLVVAYPCLSMSQDAEIVLLRRLDALEQLVFGRSRSMSAAADAPPRKVESLASKVEAVSKSVSRAEGGGRDLQNLATEGEGILIPFLSQGKVLEGDSSRCRPKGAMRLATSPLDKCIGAGTL